MADHDRAWLLRAIALATQLRYWDDVKHWKSELKKLEDEGANHG